MQNEFLSIKEVAVVFGVNEATIRRAIRKGWLIAIKIGEGKRSPYRVSKKSIDHIHELIIAKHLEISKRKLENKSTNI